MAQKIDPLEPHWNALAAADAADVAARTGCRLDADGARFVVGFLGREYVVDAEARLVRPADDPSRPANFEVGMVLLVYLAYAKDLPETGRWITEKNLPTGELFFRGLHALPTPHLAAAFGDDPDQLTEAARGLGGRSVLGPADATVDLRVLPHVPVRLQLWASDDEFDAHASMLFDASIEHQLALDAIGSMASRLVKCLCRGAG